MDIAGKFLTLVSFFRLHQGAYSCAEELCSGRGTSKLMQYCQNKLEIVIDAGVRPLLVFDGSDLFMKKSTEDERWKNR